MKEKTEYLEQLLKEQTSILSLTEKAFQQNHKALREEFGILVNQTVELFDHVDSLTRTAEMAERSQWISTHLLLMLIDFQDMQQEIIEMITMRKNELNSFWVKPERLKQQINLIEENIGENLRLAGETMNEKIIEIYQRATTRVNLDKNKLILMIEVPLFDVEEHMQYRMHSIPIKRHNEYLWNDFKHKQIIVNKALTNYMLLAGNEVVKNTYKVNTPVKKFNATTLTCEAAVFLRNMIDSCELKTGAIYEFWLPLQTSNSWLVCVPRKTTINMQYREKTEKITINDCNVIKLNKHCVMSTDNADIITQQNQENSQNIHLTQLKKLEQSWRYGRLSNETI